MTEPNGNGFNLTNGDAGRPTKYSPVCVKIARRFAQYGATNQEIAQALGVQPDTITLWSMQFPAFSRALRIGGKHADDRVAKTLYDKAVGGDLGSIVWWQKNRQPQLWRDRHEHHHTGEVVQKVEHVIAMALDGGKLEVIEADQVDDKIKQIADKPDR